jgi:hypothetical protein
MFQVVWKYAKMPQNTFLAPPELKNILFLVVLKNAQMRQNMFLTTSCFWWSESMRKCTKTRFLALHTLKNIFFENLILVVWKYAQMRKNTFLATPDINKFLF